MAYESFVNLVAALPLEDAAALSLEDIALCSTWYNSHGEALDPRPASSRIPARIEYWTVHFAPVPATSEGMRCQPLLRELINELNRGNIESLSRDELDFLLTAHGLMLRTSHAEYFARPLAHIGKHVDALNVLRTQRPLAAGLSSLQRRVDVVVETDLLAAQTRKLRSIAGLQLAFTGAVLAHWGTLRILGDIPESCLVTVDEGDCYVSGYVIGHVAATCSCEVQANISGVAIARKGDIRMRDIIDRAMVISKHGSIWCRAARGPQLVYAHQQFTARESITGGLYFAPRFIVGGQVTGATLHVSEEAVAERFTAAGTKPLELVLRRTLSHEDYGEQVERETVRLLLSAHGRRRRVREVRELMAMVGRESEHYARNALLYISGGEKVTAQIEGLETGERRLAFLDRVIAGVESMIQTVDDRYNARRLAQSKEACAEIDDSALDMLRKELQDLEQEGGIDPELTGKREEILRLHRELHEKGNEINEAVRSLTTLLDRASTWLRERHALAENLERERQNVQHSIGRVAVLERISTELSAVKVLQQILLAAKDQPAASAIVTRIRHPFVRLMLRQIENRTNRLKTYAAVLKQTEIDYQENIKTLLTEHQVQLPPAILPDEPEGGAVRGRFDAGVRIYADIRAFDARESGGAGMLETCLEEEEVTFRRGPAGSVVRS